MEEIKSIKEVLDLNINSRIFDLQGTSGARLGFSQVLGALSGSESMNGFEVVTSKHKYLALIDNQQSCCESWGYLISEDSPEDFIGANLISVEIVDTAINIKRFDDELKYLDEGGVMFINFNTDRGVFQIAVYNAHNGYYGHGVVLAKDDKVIKSDVL